MPVWFFYGEKTGSRLDWLALIASLAASALWVVVHEPAASAILLTLIDVAAFYPTVMKTWRMPYQENLTYYGLWIVRYPLVCLALKQFNVPNAVYPVTWSLISVFFVGMMLARRRHIGKS